MFKNFDNQLFDQEKKLKELLIENDSLDREIDELLNHCKVTEHQLTTYVSTREYFSESQWETIQQERRKMDEALNLKLSHIANPNKTKKAQEERLIPPHWLFVR